MSEFSFRWLLPFCIWVASLSSSALWTYGSAFVVLVGVIGETITELTSWIKPECRRKKIAKASALVLILGLTGDLIAIHKTELETAFLTKEAGDAKTSADGAALALKSAKGYLEAIASQANTLELRMENASSRLGQFEKNLSAQGPRAKLLVKAAPDLARKLTPFAGQRVGLFVCGQQGLADQETIDTWAAIANILGTGTVLGVTGAKWNIPPPNLNFAANCGAAKGLGQGLIVFVSKRASGSTMKAANVLGRGLANTLPPSPNKMPSLIDPDFATLIVDRRAQDKNAPWISPGLDPDLITVLIGAHP